MKRLIPASIRHSRMVLPDPLGHLLLVQLSHHSPADRVAAAGGTAPPAHPRD